MAEVGRLSWTVAKSLRAFVERVIANFSRQKHRFFTIERKQAIWDYYERRISFIESSTKAECLSVKALGKQDVFR